MSKRGFTFCVAMAVLVVIGLLPSASAEERKTGWSDTAEFSFVTTAGNSESSTFGLKNTLARAWDRSSVTLRAGGIRVETTSTVRFAVGTDPVREIDTDETTAENYYLDGRYDRKITDRFFWYVGAGWDRNRFAGIDNRYIGAGGVGNIWHDRDDLKFKTDYALTFTKQEDVVALPDVDDTFLGLRFSWDYLNKLGANTEYVNTLILDENLDETSDWRANMINSIAVTMSERLALKVSLQFLYDNEPSLEEVPVFDLDPADPGAIQIGTVPFELDELDTIFTVSLVVQF